MNKKIEQEHKNDSRPLLFLIVIVAVIIVNFILLSFKANALEPSLNVSYLGAWNMNYNFMAGSGACTYSNTGTTGYVTATGICSPYMWMSPQGTLAFNKDYILGVTVYIYETRDREPENGYANGAQILTVTNNGSTFQAQHIGTTYERISESATAINMYFKLDNGVSGTQYLNTSSRLTFALRMGIQTNEYMTASGSVSVLASSNPSFDNAGMIDAINNLRISNQNWLSQINQNIQELRQSLIDNSGTQQLNEAEGRSEEAAQEGQDNADSSNTDNEQASQSVLSIIGNVIGAFSTNATDCKINADLGNLDLGNLDFCKDKPSQITNMINAFGSIIVVYACYRVAKKIFMLWIKITTYAQGGNLGGNDG